MKTINKYTCNHKIIDPWNALFKKSPNHLALEENRELQLDTKYLPARIWARPLCPVVLMLALGIAVGAFFPEMVSFPLLSGTVCLLLCLKSFSRRQPMFLTPLLLVFCAGFVSVQPWLRPDFPANHISHFADTGKYTIWAEVVECLPEKPHRSRYVVAIKRLKKGDHSFSVSGRLRLTIGKASLKINRRDQLCFQARLRHPHNFNNPGGFDYERFLAFQRIWVTAYASAKNVTVTAGIYPWHQRLLTRLKRTTSAAIDKTMPSESAAIMRALVIGDKSGIDGRLREAFSRAGLSHILAISGLHLGIVGSMAYAVFRFFLIRVPVLLKYGWINRIAAILAIFPMFLYAILAGFSPSTRRALLMAGAGLLAIVCSRRTDNMAILALAVLVVLIVSPPMLFSISLQLSVMAVWGILLVYPLSTATIIRSDVHSRAAAFFVSFKKLVFASSGAILGTAPLVMYYFHLFSLTGPLLNLVVVPLTGVLVLPLGFAAAVLLWVWPWGGCELFWLNGRILSVMINMIEWIAARSWSAVMTIRPSGLEIFIYYLTLWAIVDMLRQWQLSKQAHSARPVEKTKSNLKKNAPWQWALWGLLLVFWVGDAGFWTYRRRFNQNLRLSVLDVGQGSAAVIELPGGKVFLFDGGGFYDNAIFDVGRYILAPFLLQEKIRTIDRVILSHPEADHLNGLIYLATHFNIREIWTNGQANASEGFSELMRLVEKRGIVHPPFSALPRSETINGVHVELLSPPRQFRALPNQSLNDHSIVLTLTKGQHRFLLPGDIETPTETRLCKTHGERLASTVLLVPHHGSRSSSSPAFVKLVSPRWAIVSCGWQNRFGFPHSQVIKRYAAQQVNVLTTASNGAIIIKSNGSRLRIKPQSTSVPARP